jgi:autotransporter-associated beta strand protein
MKSAISLPISKFLVFGFMAFAGLALSPGRVLGQNTAYFDLNDNAAGSGVTNNGINPWNISSNKFWSDAAAGNVSGGNIHNWLNGDVAVFSAGADAANLTYTVQPTSGVVLVSGVTVEEGSVIISNGAGGSFGMSASSIFNVANTNGAALSISSGISGTGFNLTKQGLGALTLTGSSTYSGSTIISGGSVTLGTGGALASTSNVTVNSGGTLILSGGTINNSATVTLNGGRINLNATTSEVVGALTLSSSSIIDFGTFAGPNDLIFADSTGSWTGTLSIWNWTQGTDHLFFGNVFGAGLNSTQLSQINFYSDSGTTLVGNGQYNPGGEVSPVPEPSTVFAGLTLLSLAAYRERRWVFRCREARDSHKLGA